MGRKSRVPHLFTAINAMTQILGFRKTYGINEVKVATTFSTYKYQDDHDVEYLRKLLR